MDRYVRRRAAVAFCPNGFRPGLAVARHDLGNRCYHPVMEERIIELETRVAYQDKLLCDLDQVVQAFAKRVEKAEQRLRNLEGQQLEQQDETEPHNTPPPHY